MNDNSFEVRGPRPDLRERRPNVIEVKEAVNPRRRPDSLQYEEGLAGPAASPFVQGIMSGYAAADGYTPNPAQWSGTTTQHGQVVSRLTGLDMSERPGTTVSTVEAGQANGRTPIGAVDRPPTWDYVDGPQLGNFADATRPDQHGIYEAKIAGEGGRRPNRATVRP
jgi:hypothetical protein